MTHIIGIDLGTTNSLGAVFHENGPMLIPNALGNYLTPSAVGFLADDRILTGAAALEMAVTRPERCALHFKRLMGLDQKLELADKEFTAPELSAMILKTIVSDSKAHLGRNITDVVITVPAYFNDNQRKATRLAGELVGLNVRRIINEPTAAALTYGFHEKDADKKIMVFDLGGGTFDVTLMEIFDGTLEIIATAGESNLGGQDFTEAIVAHVLQTAGLEGPGRLVLSRLHDECEIAKLELTESDKTTIRIPDEQGHFPEDGQTIELTRKTFETLIQPLMERLKHPMVRVINDGKCMPEEIDEVILVGGATRMPGISQMLQAHFGKPPLCRHNPDEVVALGAAIQAALIDDHEAVEDVVLTDVCPFTLGIEVAKRLGRSTQSGYYLPVIHRNTTVPVSREETVATLFDNQDTVTLRIYQGEARKIRDNLLLGELEVMDIPPGPEGQLVHVRFTYDMNGILEVEAIVGETGKKFRTVLTQNVKGLSEDQIQNALKRMQDIKFYPRDEARHQQLLFYGEKIIAELNPMLRSDLEDALDRFESALYGDSQEEVEASRAELVETLDRLGYGSDEHELSDSEEDEPDEPLV